MGENAERLIAKLEAGGSCVYLKSKPGTARLYLYALTVDQKATDFIRGCKASIALEEIPTYQKIFEACVTDPVLMNNRIRDRQRGQELSHRQRIQSTLHDDYKSKLNVWCLKTYKNPAFYEFFGDHTVVTIPDEKRTTFRGDGSFKREANIEAARVACQSLKIK